MTARAVYCCVRCHLENTDPDDVARKHCKFCNLFAEDLRGEAVTELRELPFTQGLTRRDCFAVALWTCKYHGNNDSRIVHGWVRNSWTGDAVQHAWVETPGVGIYVDELGNEVRLPTTVVVDYCQVDERARYLPRNFYYESVGVLASPAPKVYTVAEAVVLALIQKSDGPWETEAFDQ